MYEWIKTNVLRSVIFKIPRFVSIILTTWDPNDWHQWCRVLGHKQRTSNKTSRRVIVHTYFKLSTSNQLTPARSASAKKKKTIQNYYQNLKSLYEVHTKQTIIQQSHLITPRIVELYFFLAQRHPHISSSPPLRISCVTSSSSSTYEFSIQKRQDNRQHQPEQARVLRIRIYWGWFLYIITCGRFTYMVWEWVL